VLFVESEGRLGLPLTRMYLSPVDSSSCFSHEPRLSQKLHLSPFQFEVLKPPYLSTSFYKPVSARITSCSLPFQSFYHYQVSGDDLPIIPQALAASGSARDEWSGCQKTNLHLMNKLPKTKFNYFGPLKGVWRGPIRASKAVEITSSITSSTLPFIVEISAATSA